MSDTLEVKITVTKYNKNGFITAVGSEKLPMNQWRNEPSRGAWVVAVISSLMRAVRDDFQIPEPEDLGRGRND